MYKIKLALYVFVQEALTPKLRTTQPIKCMQPFGTVEIKEGTLNLQKYQGLWAELYALLTGCILKLRNPLCTIMNT